MRTYHQELSVGAQTGFSEAYHAAHRAEQLRSFSHLDGSVQTKTIKGKPYLYFAYRSAVNGATRQIYIGPSNPQTQALASQTGTGPAASMERLAAAALAHGNSALAPRHFRIIREIAAASFFSTGGLLIGSQAYIAIGNMLGVRWTEAAVTLDVDFAHAMKSTLSVAMPAAAEVDLHRTIIGLEMGFLPGLGLQGGTSGSYVNPSAPDLRIDFLTPRGRSDRPLTSPRLGVVLQPVRFLEYLLEQPAQTVVLARQGAVLVNVPSPDRLAVYKLLLAGCREVSDRAKVAKDIQQAAALIDYLLAHDAEALTAAWQDLIGRGPRWRQRIRIGWSLLCRDHAEVAQRLESVVGISKKSSAPSRRPTRALRHVDNGHPGSSGGPPNQVPRRT